jgi:hypothetical protein
MNLVTSDRIARVIDHIKSDEFVSKNEVVSLLQDILTLRKTDSKKQWNAAYRQGAEQLLMLLRDNYYVNMIPDSRSYRDRLIGELRNQVAETVTKGTA